MKCSEIKGYLSEYLDGCLDVQKEEEVEKHLATCEVCRRELAVLREVTGRLAGLDKIKAPPDFLHRLNTRLDSMPFYAKFLARFSQKNISYSFKLIAAVAVVVLAINLIITERPFYNPRSISNKSGKSEQALEEEKPVAKRASEKDLEEPLRRKTKEQPPKELNRITGRIPAESSPTFVPLIKDENDKLSISGKGQVPATPAPIEPVPRFSIDLKMDKKLSIATPDNKKDFTSSGMVAEMKNINKTLKQRSLLGKTARVSQPEPMKEEGPVSQQMNEEKSEIQKESISEGRSSDILDRLTRLIDSFSGKIISIEHRDDQSGRFLSIVVDIPASRFYSFTDGLQKIGSVTSSLPDVSESNERLLSLELNIYDFVKGSE